LWIILTSLACRYFSEDQDIISNYMSYFIIIRGKKKNTIKCRQTQAKEDFTKMLFLKQVSVPAGLGTSLDISRGC